jgi:hypothetical protein
MRLKEILSVLFFVALMAQARAQGETSGSCFTTEIVDSQSVSEGCTRYQLKISFDGDCQHALSHYTVAIPCGKISNLTNTENWKQVFGKDPKTGLTGFKIDDIPGFGDGALKSFYVSFTLCTESADCHATLKCWDPVVAYKAGTDIFYDTLQSKCLSLKASLKKSDVTCYGGTNGSSAVTVEEGVPPYTFAWSTGANTQSVSGLVAGPYTVTVKDATGSSISLETTISQPNPLSITGDITHASCNGIADGAVNISVSGGTGPYSFVWNTGTATEDIGGLKEGIYTVTVNDSLGCTMKKTFTVMSISRILLSSKTTLAGCNQSNGAIDLTVSGGTSPYSYVWSTGVTTEDLSMIAAGVYKVKVTDSIGCTAELVVNLRDINTLRLAATVQQTSCVDDASGAINVTVSGGTPPYTFLWSNGVTTEDLNALTSGLYKLTVTDANGCTATLTVNVSKKTFQVTSEIVKPLCYGDSTGSITLTPSGGVEPYTYEWSTGETGNSITGLPGGVYQVTVTDSTGCTKALTFAVAKPTAIIAAVSVNSTACSADASINLSVTGGKPPYSFAWSNGQTTEDIDSVSNGNYWVKIKDSNGCEILKEITVELTEPSWSCLINQPDSVPVCSSANNFLRTSVEEASYAWSVVSSDGQWTIVEGAATSQIHYTAGTQNSTATFTLTITKDGCSQSCSYVISTCATDSIGGEDPGGEDPGNGGEDPGNTETCDDCFSTEVVTLSSAGDCTTYEVVVNTDGNCRHELSHWDIVLPCGQLTDYWNSEGWKMEIGNDPTTGLYGLKVDDITGFGNEVGSFKVRFTICSAAESCREELRNWRPVVAYKAGQCIAYDTLGSGSQQPVDMKAFPNPFNTSLSFTWEATQDEYVTLDLIDKNGRNVKTVFSGYVEKGKSYQVDWNETGLSDDLYIYRYSAGDNVVYGKVFKSQ